MAKRVNYIVSAPKGWLNVREHPSLDAKIITTLEDGAKVKIDPNTDAPEGWKTVDGGGYVMAKYLR